MNQQYKKNIPQFNGEKYSFWKTRIRALLSENKLIKIVDEEKPQVVNDEWKEQNESVKNILIEYLSDSLLEFIKPNKTAKEIFSELDSIYERRSHSAQLAARRKMLFLKFDSNQELNTHIKIFEDLYNELTNAGSQENEIEKVSYLTATLPNAYNDVVTAIETLTEENITFAYVKSRLLDHEVKLKMQSCDTSTKVLQVQKENKNILNKKNEKYKKQYKFKNNKIFKGKCHHCGRKGHLKKNCFYYKKMWKQQTPSTNENCAQIAQADGFVFMLQQNEIEMQTNPNFLLDSESTDHLINNLELFEQSQQLKPPIKLSTAKNGVSITATRIGVVKLLTETNQQITLKDVLYSNEVPNNLISVKRMQKAGMCTHFLEDKIIITKNGKVVLQGKNTENLRLFNFKLNSKNQINLVKNTYELWHLRLGHIGKEKFNEIIKGNLYQDTNIIKK